jgi:tripartite-type tricarboxylate transporter receptor subunit TctC
MKKILSLILGAAMVTSLAACGGGSSTGTTAAPAASSTTAAASAETKAAESGGSTAKATNFPTKAITDIVPTSAGGSTDLYNRLIGNYIEQYIGQPFVIENKTGGAQTIGVQAIADAKPDGYTIGVGWGASFGMRPYLLNVQYSIDDFKFICGVLEQKNCIIVRSDSEWNSLDDLTKAMKEKTLNYGAGSAASYQYAWAAYLMNQLGVTANMIPHDGDADTIVALQNGSVDWVCCETTSAVSALKSGDVKMIACLGDERDDHYPDVPSVTELGYKAALKHTMALVCPKDVPDENVEVLRSGIEQTLKNEEFMQKCNDSGYNVIYKEGDECREEAETMGEIIQQMIGEGVFGEVKK